MPGLELIGIPGDYESILDTLANYLSSPPVLAAQPDTTTIEWVLGDIGMGPTQAIPVGFIAPLNLGVVPFGRGGSVGGRSGTDLLDFTIPMLIIEAEHDAKAEPVNHVANAHTGEHASGEFKEYPGYRGLIQFGEGVRRALRANIGLSGSVATSTITELRPVLIDLNNKLYRGSRLTLTARARRSRA